MSENCPMCGEPVRVYSGDEGTNSYESVAAGRIAQLQAERDAAVARAEAAEARLERVRELRYYVNTLNNMAIGMRAMRMAEDKLSAEAVTALLDYATECGNLKAELQRIPSGRGRGC